MKWEYRHNEFETWTVGFYNPATARAAWYPDSDQPTEAEAKERCRALNAITDSMLASAAQVRRYSPVLQSHALDAIAAQVRRTLGEEIR